MQSLRYAIEQTDRQTDRHADRKILRAPYEGEVKMSVNCM